MNSKRYERICEMLARRQPDLTVCMEQVHKPHNVSAVIRTADAVGVHEVHAVWPSSRMRTMASAAAGSNSWVQVKTHRTIADAVGHLKGQGMQILATHLSDKAIDFREIDYTRPTCILMGQEKTGITPELSTTGGTSDGRFIARICPQVVEFGPVTESIHQIDENVPVSDIQPLTDIYRRTLEKLFL